MLQLFKTIQSSLLIVVLFVFYYFLGLVILKSLAKKTSKNMNKLEIVLISFFIGLFFHTWLSFIIALIIKNIIRGHIISILLGIAFIIYKQKPIKINYEIFKDINKHKVALLLFLVIVVILLFTVFFRFDNEDVYASPPSYGDWALHTSLINNFANGNNIPPMYTYYSGTKLGYPFLNFYANALLVNLGLDIFYASNTFHFILTFSLLVMSYFFAIRLFGKKTYALLFSILLFFGGGLGWIYLSQSDKTFFSAIEETDYFVMHAKNIVPLNLSIHSYSQRTGLLGWIYMFIVFILIFDEVFLLEKWKKIKHYSLVMILLGGMFLFHSYGFLIIMIFLASIWIQKPVKSLFILLAGSSLLALPQLLWTSNQTMRKGFIKLIWGLYVPFKRPIAFLLLWIQNFGGMLVFAIVGFNKKYKHLLLPLLIFFIIGNTIQLQPWEFDNHKWLIGCYFVLCIFGVMGIREVWGSKWSRKVIVRRTMTVLLIAMILFPSFLGTYHYYTKKWHFSKRSDQIVGEFIGELVPQNAAILTGTQHNHPVFLYSSRPIFEGYRGWIWTHGLQLDRDQEMQAMFESTNKTEACRLFNKHKIKYVYISDWERNEDLYELNEDFFVDNFNIIYKKKDNFLFKIDCSLN
jgi:hypothetical protein